MSDITILGGGIIGLLTARELAATGASITLIDQADIGTESSWAGGGILSPLYPWTYSNAVNDLASWGQAHYSALAADLYEETSIDPQWFPCGMLVLDCDDPEAMNHWAEHYRVARQALDAEQIQASLPGLNQAMDRGLWLPEIANIRNPRLLKAVKQTLETKGVQFLTREKVTNLGWSKNRITRIVTEHRSLDVNKLVICAGAWTSQLAEMIGLRMQIKPVMGQMILIDSKPDVVPCMVLKAGQYIIPRKDGKILTGSTLEDTGFEKTQTDQAREDLYRFAVDLVPALADYPIERHWAGLRPGSPDGIPVIGPHPDFVNLFFNAGHFRNGVVLAPASARLLTDLVTGREPILEPAPYLPEKHIS